MSYQGSSWRAKRANTNVTPVEGDDWTIVAQKGDDGPGGGTVTSVSADGPLSVTNATTTPNISLGIVPAAKGGTGLSSPGASGQFLRSNGGAWTSALLSAPDIPAGSAHYIQNSTSQQAATDFNIGGTGAANILNAATQYNLGGSRILGNAGTNNLFAGTDAGASNTTGNANAFFGQNAGQSNTTGTSNEFFGYNAGNRTTTGGNNSFFGDAVGFFNTTGGSNSFFGFLAGFNNTTANDNAFFGRGAGFSNTTGFANSFFGRSAGVFNTTGGENSFFGRSAGFSNTTGTFNAFFGKDAGGSNTTGSSNAFFGTSAGSFNAGGFSNTFIGDSTNFDAPGATGFDNTLLGFSTKVGATLINATAIGANAQVTQSNSLVLGMISGVNNGFANTNVGIGTTAPKAKLDVTGGNILVASPGQGIILKSPNGATCRLLSIDNAGNMTLAAVACP